VDDSAGTFYDDLAPYYHLMFRDWNQSIQWQASILGPLIEREMSKSVLRILDCACGIGTQSLALAERGHTLTGVDLSAAAIARAQIEAQQRGLSIRFTVADMRDLSALEESNFNVVLAADNALPHLLSDLDLRRAVQQIVGKLRPGGLFLATIRDYDQTLEQHPAVSHPAFVQDGTYRRMYHQVWDWTSDRQYTVHLYLTWQTDAGWSCRHFVSIYRAVRRDELTAMMRKAGFVQVRWLMPADGRFYQPIILAGMWNDGKRRVAPEYIGVTNLPDDLGGSPRIPEIYSRRVRIVCRSCRLQSV
jgi:2-polyprenyl-3-methyl-5-hydroxy-6-metoxy-1,4-benzoquinol methylase